MGLLDNNYQRATKSAMQLREENGILAMDGGELIVKRPLADDRVHFEGSDQVRGKMAELFTPALRLAMVAMHPRS